MTKEKKEKDLTFVTFEGKDYDIDKITERSKYYIKQMGYLQEEMAELQAAIERSKMALDGYSTLLKDEIVKKPE